MLSKNSTLKLFPITIRKDKINYIIENERTGEFFEMPEICVDAIHWIQDQFSLKEIEEKLVNKYPNEEVDILDFVEQLLELQLVMEVDGVLVEQNIKNNVVKRFNWISPSFAKLIIHRYSIGILFLLVLVNIVLFATDSTLLPNYQVVFLFDSIVLSLVTYLIVSLILLLIHELGHILAMRAYNLPTNLDISNRLLVLIVLETDMTAGWKLPPKKRNVLFLSGVYMEQWILFLTILCKLCLPIEGNLIDSILSIVIFDIFVKTVYQCCFYIRTDFYYLFENVTSCYNIMDHSKNYLKKWLPFLHVPTTTEPYEREIKYVVIFSIFQVIGVGFTFLILILYSIPQVIYVYANLLPYLFTPENTKNFWEAIFIVGQSIVFLFLLVFTWIKGYKEKRNI
jgi:putative peptide zinc metalloprotease protein